MNHTTEQSNKHSNDEVRKTSTSIIEMSRCEPKQIECLFQSWLLKKLHWKDDEKKTEKHTKNLPFSHR